MCHAPATLRNREPIADVLQRELPLSGAVLEIASGTGEHAVYFAGRFPGLRWQPSDPDPDARESIAARVRASGLPNLCLPFELDAAAREWPIEQVNAIVCVNMVHISPWAATEGLFAHAARMLDSGEKLILYGPYFEDDVETAKSNLDFDSRLRAQNPQWGLRNLAQIASLARSSRLARAARYDMPANNLALVYSRSE